MKVRSWSLCVQMPKPMKYFRQFHPRVHACMLRRVRLCVTPWTIAFQAPLSMGFSRQEYWSGLPFPTPREFPDSGIKSVSVASPALAGGFFTTSATCGEGSGTPLQCSCLENPMDGGAWWAAVYGVAQSRAGLKWLSSSSSSAYVSMLLSPFCFTEVTRFGLSQMYGFHMS